MDDVVLVGYLHRADEWEAQGAKYAAATVRDLVAEVRSAWASRTECQQDAQRMSAHIVQIENIVAAALGDQLDPEWQMRARVLLTERPQVGECRCDERLADAIPLDAFKPAPWPITASDDTATEPEDGGS